SIGMTKDASGRVIAFTTVADNEPANGNEGVDTLSSVERLEFANRTLDLTDPVQLFDLNNSLVRTSGTISEVLQYAQDNYTIRLAAVVYDEDVTIGVGVRIVGASTGAVGERDAADGVGEST